MSTPTPPWKYLVRKPKSVYKHLFIKDRWVSAMTVYGALMRDNDPMTAEEIAYDRDLPLEAVLEAIAYCQSDPPEIRSDLAIEAEIAHLTGTDQPDYWKPGKRRLLTSEEMARIYKL